MEWGISFKEVLDRETQSETRRYMCISNTELAPVAVGTANSSADKGRNKYYKRVY